MNGNRLLTARLFLLALIVMVSTMAWADRQQVYQRQAKDSVTISTSHLREFPTGKILQSAYPVKLAVKGRSLRVTSEYEQVLPIYTQGGALYVAMQLTPGVNWLNGLPRGRYRINNRTIRIK